MNSFKLATMCALVAIFMKLPIPANTYGIEVVLISIFFYASLFFFCKSIGEDE